MPFSLLGNISSLSPLTRIDKGKPFFWAKTWSVFFPFQNSPKDLDPFYKMDLEFWDYSRSICKTYIEFWDCFGREKTIL